MTIEAASPRTGATHAAADHVWAIMCRYFRQSETGLFYDYIDPYTVGRVNLPTVGQIEADIPNSNGWSTPLEDCCLYGSRLLCTLVERAKVTGRERHRSEARELFHALHRLWKASSYAGFVPRGVMPDGKTHYRDSSVDQESHWVAGLWQYYRSGLAIEPELALIRDAISRFTSSVEEHGWLLLREDGALTSWGDLRSGNPPRGPLVLLMLLAVAADVTGLPRWLAEYRRHRDGEAGDIAALLSSEALLGKPVWVTCQTARLLAVLSRLEQEGLWRQRFDAARLGIALRAAPALEAWRSYDPALGRLDYGHRNSTYRDPLAAAISVSLCPDEDAVAGALDVCEDAVSSYPYAREGKALAELEPVLHYYWHLAARGVLAYDRALDGVSGGEILPVPAGGRYRLHVIEWFDAESREYRGAPNRPGLPESQHRFVP